VDGSAEQELDSGMKRLNSGFTLIELMIDHWRTGGYSDTAVSELHSQSAGCRRIEPFVRSQDRSSGICDGQWQFS
jgi:hypothetical protein